MGKNKKKGKKGQDEFFEQLTKTSEWQTGPVSAMDEDDMVPVPASTMQPPATQGMDTDDKPSKGIKLGVAKVSMKRGQKTRKQQLRKKAGVEKAVARADKKDVTLKGKAGKKAMKAALKHVYD